MISKMISVFISGYPQTPPPIKGGWDLIITKNQMKYNFKDFLWVIDVIFDISPIENSQIHIFHIFL